MTIAVDMGRKATKTTNKPTRNPGSAPGLISEEEENGLTHQEIFMQMHRFLASNP